MQLWNAAGCYVTSGLVVMTFCMKDIVPLRIVALASNLAVVGAEVWVIESVTGRLRIAGRFFGSVAVGNVADHRPALKSYNDAFADVGWSKSIHHKPF